MNKVFLKYTFLITSGLLLFISISTFAQKSLKVGNVYPGEVELGGFNLLQDDYISIKGKGASFDKGDGSLRYYAWILRTDSREVVWRSEDTEDYSRDDGEYKFNEKLKLDAGNYEVYYTGGKASNVYFIDGFDMLQNLFRKQRCDYDEFRNEFFVKILSNSSSFKITDPEEAVNKKEGVIVSLIRVGDYENLQKGFSLKKETKVNIYALGEGVKSEFYDLGYIYDVSQNKKVWMFNRKDGSYAGGGKKNTVQKTTIILSKGSYKVYYKSDDSHSYDEWNVLAPDDPQHWGIEVSLVNKNDKKNVIPFRKEDIVEPIVEMIKVEEEEYLSQGISLSKKTKLRVLSIGEGRRELVDYGWIVNADTREIVWKMTEDNTEYAGGGKKNRMVDEVIELNSGNYIVNYITDDSHNYDDWNTTPPFDEERWGITIWTVNKNDRRSVKIFNPKKYRSKNLIAEIIEVGDDEYLKKSFTLDRTTDVRIIALGESDGHELADYAWIKDSFGDTVWEMKYRNTTHAGGARKNRIFNDVIKLRPGRYKVYYSTDDSHSFEEWNMNPPDNPQMYGVTLLYDK